MICSSMGKMFDVLSCENLMLFLILVRRPSPCLRVRSVLIGVK